MAVLGLRFCVRAFSSCGKRGPLFIAVRGPLSRPLLLRSTGSRRAGSATVAHGPSCSVACGIFPDQGLNPCTLHWQADSQPLCHQGSPQESLNLIKQLALWVVRCGPDHWLVDSLVLACSRLTGWLQTTMRVTWDRAVSCRWACCASAGVACCSVCLWLPRFSLPQFPCCQNIQSEQC